MYFVYINGCIRHKAIVVYSKRLLLSGTSLEIEECGLFLLLGFGFFLHRSGLCIRHFLERIGLKLQALGQCVTDPRKVRQCVEIDLGDVVLVPDAVVEQRPRPRPSDAS